MESIMGLARLSGPMVLFTKENGEIARSTDEVSS